MSQHDAFGQAGRAAGVGHHDHVGPGRDRHLRHAAAGLEQAGEAGRFRRLAEDKDLLESGLPARLAGALQQRRNRDQEAGAGVRQLLAELSRRVQGVHRRGDPAQHRDRVQHRGILRKVGAVDGEDVPLAKASLLKSGRQSADGVGQRRVGHGSSRRSVDQRRPITVPGRFADHEFGQGHLRDLDIGETAAEDHAQDPIRALRSSRLRAIERRWISSVPS